MIGVTLGDYRIVTELGSGSMGTVYYAEHTRMGRRAAIKVLSPRVASDPEVVERFIAEARIVNEIRHPNIVDITDFGEEEGVHFLVMELLEGETLGARLEREKRIEPVLAVRILSDACAAVAAAHERNVVHRDLKPENIFLLRHADAPVRAKVLDFGLAKLLGPGAAETTPGNILGTPAYMSPEQCLGEGDVDARSDVYALGVVAFEMLTGKPPFSSATLGRLILAHVQDLAPPLRDVAPEVPPALAEAVARALAKKPEDRFQTVRELRAALRGAVELEFLATQPEIALTHAAAPAAWAEKRRELARERAARVGRKLREIVARRLERDRLVLPSMPLSFVQCLELMRRTDVRFAELAAVLEQDPHLASRILRVVNSPVYGALEPAATVEQAVARLGLRPLGNLLVELSAREIFVSRNPLILTMFRAIWGHCLGVAMIARDLAAALPGEVAPDTAYLAGLLHDVGKPIVAALLLEVERDLGTHADRPWLEGPEWLAIVSECHREVAAEIAKRWNLPAPVAAAIRGIDAYEPEAGPASCTNLVRLANGLAKREGLGVGENPPEEALQALIDEGIALVGAAPEVLREVVADLRARVDAITGAFQAPNRGGRAVRPAEFSRTQPVPGAKAAEVPAGAKPTEAKPSETPSDAKPAEPGIGESVAAAATAEGEASARKTSEGEPRDAAPSPASTDATGDATEGSG